MDLIPFVLLFALMWFLVIRPQQARLRKQRELVASVAVGDEVLSMGGIIGTVRVLTDDELRLEVSPGVEVRLARAAVSRRLSGAGDRAAGGGGAGDNGQVGDGGSDQVGPEEER